MALPYWDSSLDFDLANPVDSMIWSPEFLGNGDGFVTTGPFANWQTPSGPLTRNIGGSSRLISKEVIATILTRCMTAEISEPTAEMRYNLELAHGGPHVWVGGQMAGLNTAAHDPVFFLHHAFIDYIWEQFRRRQSMFCRVNPETDYPMAIGQHAADRPMDGFQRYRAIDGYMSFWTRFWFDYEQSPWCSFWRPFCSTPYLRCDMRRQRCVALPRATAAGTGAATEGRLGIGPLTALASANARVATATRGRAQESVINVGQRFRAPPSDGRTNGGIQAAIRGIQRPADIIQVGLLGSSRVRVGDNFGPTFNAPPSDGRTNDRRLVAETPNIASQNRWNMVDGQEITAGSGQTSGALSAGNSLRPPIQNTFFLNGRSEIDLWVFIPARVIHRRTETGRFASFPVHNGNPSTTEDVFSQVNYPDMATQTRQSLARTYEHCKTDRSGARQIIVTSDGLNYMGTFSDYALIDSRLPTASAMTYIGVKSPDKGSTEVLLAAHDGCGRMCEPHCLVMTTGAPSYKPCNGVLRITSENPKHYGKTFGAAVDSVWQLNAGRIADENVPLMFYCKYDSWPWKNCNTNKRSSIK